MSWRRAVGIGLPLAALLVFLPATQAGWLSLDDDAYVLANPLVRGGVGLAGLWSAVSSTHGSLWIPLAWISHMLDVSLFGLDPAGHHLTSVLLHAVNTGLLFLVLTRLTGAPARSALVTVLFAFHPLRVESVAWIAERKDVLVALFSLLAIGAYQRWTERPTPRRYLLVCVLMALALASKPMAVTLPVLLLLLDYWPLGRGARGLGRLVAEKLPFWALSAAAAMAALVVAGDDGLLADPHAFGVRAGNALVSYVRYAALMAWPASLGVYYPFPPPWPPATVAGAALLLLAIGIAAVVANRRTPYVAVGYAWYLVALLPVIGFVQAGGQGMADRFTYLPMIGVLVACVWGAADLLGSSRPARLAGGLAAGIAVGVLVALTQRQLGYWRSAETLYERTLAVTTGNWLIHHNLGELQLRRGAAGDAASHFERALAIEPRYAHAAFQLGIAQTALGNPHDAIDSYRRALAIDPRLAKAHNNLGALLLREGRRDDAIGHFATALRLDPSSRSARRNFTRALAAGGVPQERIEEYVRVATQSATPPVPR